MTTANPRAGPMAVTHLNSTFKVDIGGASNLLGQAGNTHTTTS